MRLFVYGTLKRGFGNNRLLHGATFVREDSITAFLYSSGVPFATPGPGIVHGEVFDVPEELVPRLDSLEGHPHGYKRTVMPLHGGGTAEAYMWFHAPYGQALPEGRYGASTL
jgi:gamma-glutamylaminecyclotransferase